MSNIDPTALYQEVRWLFESEAGRAAVIRFMLDLYNRVGGPSDSVQAAQLASNEAQAGVTSLQASTASLEASQTSLTAQIASNDDDIADLQAKFDGAPAYSETNVTTDRAYDADSTTVEELADVLGTVIADLRAKGVLG